MVIPNFLAAFYFKLLKRQHASASAVSAVDRTKSDK